MRRAAKILVGFTGFAIVVTAVGVWMAPQAFAQVRAALVRDVDHPANAPFAWESIAFSHPVIFGSFVVPATTSDGRNVQRLVIETVSAFCTGLSTPAPGVRVIGPTTTPGIGTINYELFVPFPTNATSDQLVQAQTRLYVNPGATAFINVLEFENAGTCSFSMAGHFVTQ